MSAANETVSAPASAIQEQMWLGEMLRGADAVYTMAEVLRVDAVLDPARLSDAIVSLQLRHEALRTTFEPAGTGVRQVIHRSYPIPVLTHVLDPEGDHEREFRTVLDGILAEPFTLDRPPLWRCLVGTAGPVSYLAIVMHHIVADGWSLRILVNELGTLYLGAEPAGKPRSYREFSAEQRDWLASAEAHESKRHWRRELAGAPSTTTLPGPGRHNSRRGQRLSFPFPDGTERRVAEVAGAEGATPYMIYIAVYAIVLARRCGREDLVIGSPTANRGRADYLDTVGLFLNPLPLRIRLRPATTLRTAVKVVREAVLGALEHQELPFSAVVKAARVDREAGPNPLFQTLAGARTDQVATLRFAGHQAWRLPSSTGTAKYDLMVTFPDEDDDRIGLVVEFDLGRYDARYVRGVAADYLRILEFLLADPADAEVAVVVTGSEQSGFVPVHRLFELVARGQPDRIAAVSDNRWWTYAELDERATRIAAALRGLGVAKGSIVAIRLPRGIDFVATAIAVVRLGAAYLPADVGWPDARVRQVLSDAGAEVMVVAENGQTVEDAAGMTVLAVANAVADPAASPEPDVAVEPRDLAVVVYTSGSTGTPKGVMIEHGSLCQFFAAGQQYLAHPDDRVAHHCNLAFDATTYELWGTLLVGATLIIPTHREMGPAEYAALFGSSTVAFVTTGLFTELTRHRDCRIALRALRLLIVGGDVLDPAVLTSFDRPGQIRLHAYGPTETTTFATMGSLDGRTDWNTVPIGSAIAGTWCSVLDTRMRPVAPGEQGELYIGGAGVARGYLGQPRLTAQRFLPDPIRPGQRVYATGDRVRLLEDGSLDFIGRRDHQVKVRGFRVELGEIEAVLRQSPQVEVARALVHGSGASDRRLVAVAQVATGTDRDAVAGELRAALRAAMPAFMQPHDMVVTDRLPLTPNGKVDLAAVLAGTTGIPAPGPEGSTAVRRMAAVWRRVLGVPVAPDAEFFALGGDSLTALRLLVAVESEFGVSLRVSELFGNSDLRGFTDTVTEQARQPTAAARPCPMPRPDPIPLSFSQSRLWFLNRLEGMAGGYNISLAFRIRGPLDQDALAAALADVVERHEILRTVFPETNGVPRQVIRTERADRPALGVVDGSGDGNGLAQAIADAARGGFDLTAEPPLRATLFGVDGDEHVLLLVLHHIAADGWSLTPLTRDLATAYAARRSGRAPGWSPLPVQYADYTLWQRENLGADDDPRSVTARDLAFWTEALDGLPEQLDLPTDRPRPAVARHLGSRVPIAIDPALHGRLRTMVRQQETTLFMALQAGLAALLSRMGAGTDIPIGSPVAGRSDAVTNDVIGCFVNTIVLRADTSGDPTFSELLARLRPVNLAAHAHQEVPFERVVEVLNPARSLSRHPLFQVMLAYQSDAEPRLELDGLQTRRESIGLDVAKFDLALHLFAHPESAGLHGFLQYSAELFDHATVEALAGRLQRLLSAVAADPDLPISRIDLLFSEEHHQVLAEWNDTGHSVPSTTVPAMVERQAARTPRATALVFGQTRLSYAELDDMADRVAHRLVTCGAGPERVVAVALPRSVELVVALLAVLKSGAAYLPVDPELPPDRIALLYEDAQPVLVLDNPAWLAGTGPDLAADARKPAPRNPAYVIYTSGSTGRPKAVVVPHEGIVNRLLWTQAKLGLQPDDRVLQKTPAGFDVSVWELFWPLCTGATLVLARPGGHREPSYLAELIHAESITTVHFVPPMLRAFLDEPGSARCPSLRRVLCGGEALPPDLVALAHARLSVEVHNMYGPTEASVDVTSWRCAPHAGTVPIGRPVWNTRAYVLDAHLRPVPPRVRGELYLSGVQLARGYLGRPALTAERFVADPYAACGGRMYRTGDLASWTADGVLEFHGRVDRQTKIRGIRIEPGETESALIKLPGVARAAVVVRDDRPDDRRLVGYVVPAPNAELVLAELRQTLATQLPDYLVPDLLVTLPELPFTTSGKLDRKALPVPLTGSGADERGSGTPLEELLRELFAETLGLARIGMHDSFFDLGGNSLLLVRLVSELRRRTGLEVSLRTMFETQTVAALSRVLDGGAESGARPDLATEAVLDPTIAIEPGTDTVRTGDPREVLLTGATGFLGAFLLRSLLDRTTARVTCLVRANDAGGATERIRQSLQGFRLWDDELGPRILALPGDLERPLLGLPDAEFDRLAERLDAIYHNGARVSIVEPYAGLRAANVTGTQEVLRLAARSRAIPVHYISTCSTLLADGPGPELLTEDRRVAPELVPANGYVCSKWVAEELVRTAGRRGIPVAIYRPGRISGHSRTGATGIDDAFWHFVRACIEIGAVPRNGGRHAEANLVPVDYVADAIVHLALHGELDGTRYNLVSASPTALSTVLRRFAAAGYEVDPVPYAEWLRLLTTAAERIGPHPGSSVAVVATMHSPGGSEGTIARFDQRNTMRGLTGSGIRCPAVDDAVLDRYVHYFVESGFLPEAG